MIVDGDVQLVDAQGREVPECAALVEAGHYFEIVPHRDCPRSETGVVHGDVFSERGHFTQIECLVEWCAPSE